MQQSDLPTGYPLPRRLLSSPFFKFGLRYKTSLNNMMFTSFMLCTIKRTILCFLFQNVHLEHLDLAGNQISHVSDLAYLKNLKVIFKTRMIHQFLLLDKGEKFRDFCYVKDLCIAGFLNCLEMIRLT